MKLQLPKQFKFLFKPKRYKVIYSGRAAAKSWSIAQSLLILGAQSTKRILCTREFQNSIADSVHKLLSDINERFKLGYEVTNNSIYHPSTGTEFMFYGLRSNITKIKSLEGVDVCWIEEAETITNDSLKVLIPTIRKNDSEIWVSFNPMNESDAVYEKFVKPHTSHIETYGFFEDDHAYVLKTVYSENPFLPDTIQKEIDKLKHDDYKEYLHVYRGDPAHEHQDILINPLWFDAAIDAHIKLNFKPLGVKVIGFDPADEGQDEKAYARRHGVVVQELKSWKDGKLEEAVERTFEDAENAKVQEIVYDSIGIGAGAKIKFKQLDPKERFVITAFVGSESPDNAEDAYEEGDMLNRDMFRNKRTQYYWLLRRRFEKTYNAVTKGEYIDPAEMISLSSDCDNLNALRAEITKIRRKRSNTTSVVQVESKQDMKKRGLKSPNLADALMYVFADKGLEINETPKINFQSQW